MAGRPPKNTPANKLKAELKSIAKQEDMYCTHCGKFKKPEDFYKSSASSNIHFGRMTVCINCIVKMYDKLFEVSESQRKSIYEICAEINIPFIDAVCQASIDGKAHTIRGYITKINSLPQYKGMTFKDGEIGSNIQLVDSVKNIDCEELISEITEVTQDMVRFWGNLPKPDILWLQTEYTDWCRRYKVDTKAMEFIVKQICQVSLQIYKKNEQGNFPQKEIESLQKLMDSAALKPVQENSANGNGNITPMMWIQKFENERPVCDEKLEEFRDVDGIWKLIRIFFVGHLCKMLNMQNEFSEEYEMEMLKYSVESDELDSYEGVEEDGME